MNSVGFAEYVRSLVRGDHEANERIEQVLNQTGWYGYPDFLEEAFFLAVDLWFGRPPDRGEIIRFVADMRAEHDEDVPFIDQHFAEHLINAAIAGERIDPGVNSEMVGRVQSLVLYEILSDHRLTAGQIDAFLAEVVRRTDK